MQTNVQVNLISGIDSALRAVTMLRRKGIKFYEISIYGNSLSLIIPIETESIVRAQLSKLSDIEVLVN
ncbi:hypothetical protein [Acetoanaerobium noterae]|uniref:hypothetical protein n=1 Tax=Acetoanaerobium noterae TaxID=745369 RepID=UPI0028AA2651|nr:hypothetical protein [Acetoanaerobium noterae]